MKILFPFLLVPGLALAAPPAADVVSACLHGESRGAAGLTGIDTTTLYQDDAFARGFSTTLYRTASGYAGYAERAGTAALVWGRTLIPLRRARALGRPGMQPPPFTPLLADWSTIREGSRRFLCVSFNFDGIGQSGSFQKIRGLYLLPLPARGRSSTLYFAVGNIDRD